MARLAKSLHVCPSLRSSCPFSRSCGFGVSMKRSIGRREQRYGAMAAAGSVPTIAGSLSSPAAWTSASPSPGPLLELPMGVILNVLAFLDAEALMACAQTCTEIWELSDFAGLWEGISTSLYPPSKHAQDPLVYHNDAKALVLDRNHRYRVLCFGFDVADVERADRRFSPVYQIEDYSFQLIVDPTGNSFVQMPRPGVSVYLSCCPTAQVTGLDEDGRMQVQESAGEESTWQCCAAFSLTIHNASKARRDVTWHSNLVDDRFYPGCREWGVHRLLSLRRLRDPTNGWLDEQGRLRVVARLCLQHMTLKIVTTESLRSHQGFGVVDPTDKALCGVMTLELPQCTRLSSLRSQVATYMGLASPDRVRLWVFTQPWAESVSAPRVLLTDPADGPSPSILPLLGPHMDGINEVRLWAEIGGDGGYQQAPQVVDEEEGMVVVAESDALEPTSGGHALVHPTVMPEPLLPVDPLAPDHQPPIPPPDPNHWAVLFLKFCEPGQGGRVRHLTHVVVKGSEPLARLFSLVSSLVGGVPMADLRAIAEAPPAQWQAFKNDDKEEEHEQAGESEEQQQVRRVLTSMSVPTPRGPDDDTTVLGAKIENGQILCFYAAEDLELMVEAYGRFLSKLLDEAWALYHYTGSKATVLTSPPQQPTRGAGESGGRVRRLRPRLSFDVLTDLFERLGHQRFRIRNAFYERRHKDARETLEYAIVGRHLGFCCDLCGKTDFAGRRYKCTQCFDYDLCSDCHASASDSSFSHRYRFNHREWKKEDFTAHQRSHVMQVIPSIPFNLDLGQQQPQHKA